MTEEKGTWFTEELYLAMSQGFQIYDEYEMGWAADWNPKMVNIYKSLGADPSRRMVTFRLIFDTQKHPFERHPVMEYKSPNQAS